jgi:hypothetical protein
VDAALADLTPAITAAVDKLSPPQARAWAALLGERLVRLLCGRQAGKTFLVALWLLVGALLTAGSVNVYLALTKESAKRAIWPELLLVGGMLGIPESCFKLHGGVVSLPNGSVVLVMGTDDKATIETWRGSKLNRVAIDEMGSQSPEWIAYMVREIVWWCIMRHDGAIALLGTPGLIADGYWWEQTKPSDVADSALHHWTVFDNPGIPHASAFIEETLRINKWTTDAPQYQREVLGVWTRDDGAVVYPYDEKAHGLDALPTTSEDGSPVPLASWSYTVAANLARPERVAWVVLASNRPLASVVIVEADTALLDPEPAALRLRARLDAYPEADMVIDAGDLGEAHVMSLRRRHDLPAAAADKDAKPSAIRDMRGAVMSGAVRVLRGEATRSLRDAWNVLGWHPRKPVMHNPAQVEQDQVAAAAAYGYRRVPVHTVYPRAHVLGSKSWGDKMKAHLLERAAARERGGYAIERLER